MFCSHLDSGQSRPALPFPDLATRPSCSVADRSDAIGSDRGESVEHDRRDAGGIGPRSQKIDCVDDRQRNEVLQAGQRRMVQSGIDNLFRPRLPVQRQDQGQRITGRKIMNRSLPCLDGDGMSMLVGIGWLIFHIVKASQPPVLGPAKVGASGIDPQPPIRGFS
jgi:hypothetical protein